MSIRPAVDIEDVRDMNNIVVHSLNYHLQRVSVRFYMIIASGNKSGVNYIMQ